MELEPIAWGYGLLEGPRVDEAGRLYFSDVTKGGIYRRSRRGEIETLVPKQRGVGGIALHAEGGIVISGRNVSHVRGTERRVLLEVDGVRGFNDLFTDADGRVYAGSLRDHPFQFQDRTPGECYRIDGEGKAMELYGDVGLSNGIGFSPDGRTIYHSDSAAAAVLAHHLASDGTATDRRELFKTESGFPDGLAVDERGRIWIAVYGGGCVAVHEPDGSLQRRIDVPARQVTSLCFGGADRCDLYIVTADNSEDPAREGTIFRARVDVPGLEAPPARI